jgi:DnaK suppressor protein
MLNSEKIDFYKKRLLEDKRRLMAEVEESQNPQNFGNDVDSFDEETDEAEEVANKLAVAQSIKDRINEIDSSLNKIVLGKYGVCEKCSQEISDKVLEIAPESKLCEDCKKSALE